jgi:hypothetical protein
MVKSKNHLKKKKVLSQMHVVCIGLLAFFFAGIFFFHIHSQLHSYTTLLNYITMLSSVLLCRIETWASNKTAHLG